MVFVSEVSLAHFSSCDKVQVHVAANAIISFFSWLSSVLLCKYYRISFIHFSVGHLGGFHVLTVVNGAAVNPGVRVSFWIMILQIMCPGVGLLDHSSVFSSIRNLCIVLHKGCIN